MSTLEPVVMAKWDYGFLDSDIIYALRHNKSSGVARPVKMGGQAVGYAVFQVGKEL